MSGLTKVKGLPKGLLASVFLHLGVYGSALGVIAWNEAHAEFRADIDQTNAPLMTLDTKYQPPPPETWIEAKKTKAQPTPVQATPTPEPAAAVVTKRPPSWVGGLITDEDYPSELKQEKKEGRVIVEVLIDIQGYVKAVSIVQGSEAQFNDVVLTKLKEARFRPALDQAGQPINCRVRVPIAFHWH